MERGDGREDWGEVRGDGSTEGLRDMDALLDTEVLRRAGELDNRP